MARDAVWAIVVAGGSGRRYGGTKQFELLGGRPVHTWAVEAARSVADGVVLVVPEGAEIALYDEPADGRGPGPVGAGSTSSQAERHERDHRPDFVVTGGATRAASVRAGLLAVPNAAAVIVVHDAARPLATAALFEEVVAAVGAGASAVVPGLPIADTVKQVDGAIVRATLDRRQLVRVQTPQGFIAAALRQAHAGEPEGTDDASLLEALGMAVVVVAGEEHNLKITTPPDLALAEWWLKQRSSPDGPGAAAEGAEGAKGSKGPEEGEHQDRRGLRRPPVLDRS